MRLSNSPNVPSNNTPVPPGKPKRRYDIDFLRIVLTWSVLVYHSIIPWMSLKWFPFKDISGIYTSAGARLTADIIAMTLDAFQMPLFFFLSGQSVYFALFFRSPLIFMVERVHRLITPMLTVMLFLSPLMRWVAVTLSVPSPCYPNKQYKALWHGNSLDCRWYTNRDAWKGGLFPVPEHMWFTLYLFYYSIIFYFLVFHRHPNIDLNKWARLKRALNCLFLGKWAAGIKLILIPALWLALIEYFLRPPFPDKRGSTTIDWANHLHFSSTFLMGFFLETIDDCAFEKILSKCAFIVFCGLFGIGMSIGSALCQIWLIPGHNIIRGIASWISIIFFSCLFRRCFKGKFGSKLRTLSILTLPFYMLHLLVEWTIAAWSVTTGGIISGFWLGYPILLFSTTGCTLILSYFVYRIQCGNVSIRYFFGISNKKKKAKPDPKQWYCEQAMKTLEGGREELLAKKEPDDISPQEEDEEEIGRCTLLKNFFCRKDFIIVYIMLVLLIGEVGIFYLIQYI